MAEEFARYDFGGYATRNDCRCADGLTIRHNAFKDCDGVVVPMVWAHRHNEPTNVLGKCLLENRADGVYTYGLFNDTENGEYAKHLVKHGDISGLSIFANHIKKAGSDVIHGTIREVSLVLAGANPGAYIDEVVAHDDVDNETNEAFIYSEPYAIDLDPEGPIAHSDIEHADDEKEEENVADSKNKKTIQDVIDSMTEEQKDVLYYVVGEALGGDKNTNEEEENVKHNMFDAENNSEEFVLSHEDMGEIFADAKRMGSLKESVLSHADQYGVKDINMLFPDAKAISESPDFIKRETEWVSTLMSATKHAPFTRIKSIHANITADEARAKGYIKGKKKMEEVIALLKRSTDPQTIYKKQKLDRDDILDITDFNVVAWLKGEMRIMLDEEIARAVLVGDGRSSVAEDKVSEDHIRPIWTDSDVYTVKARSIYDTTSTDESRAKDLIKRVVKARKEYKGSGNPTFWTTEDVLTEMLLLEDTTGRKLYNSIADLATAMRVSKIVTVPVMEGMKHKVKDESLSDTKEEDYYLDGILVNPIDYTIGTDAGGQVTMFDDFDIDYNQQKYLIETRISGALTKPYSAISFEHRVKTA
nr:MAG TPA: major capsid protein [Caudoviricetes sp.]